MTRKAFLFPGQGSQLSGMGSSLYEAYPDIRYIFDQADEILGYGLRNLMFYGAEEELKRTEVTQPAVFVYSYATFKAKSIDSPIAVAGHSLGELTAIVATEALDFESGLKLVDARARAMQTACEMTDSTMAAILGLDDEIVRKVCEETQGVVVAANFNCPGQVVISGEKNAVALASEACKAAGAKRALPLPVGGAFHSPLMAPAVDLFAKAIQHTKFKTPSVPIFQNVDGKASTNADEIKQKLVNQLTASVLWTSIIDGMQNIGVEEYVEFGSKVLGGFVKKIYKEALVTSFE